MAGTAEFVSGWLAGLGCCYRSGMFSRRTDWNLAPNRLAAALESRRRTGREILDLTISNPTRTGLDYPLNAIAAALADGARHPYDPQARGDPAAREAVALWYAGRGLTVDPARIVLTASTSEAYAWLFKLLCEPGDCVLVPRPSYPLFEFLAALESVRVASYPLRYETRWEVDFEAIERHLLEESARCGPGAAVSGTVGPGPAEPTPFSPDPRRAHAIELPVAAGSKKFLCDAPRAPGTTRAIIAVNPNNPTGSFLSGAEIEQLCALARERDLPLVCDEVFSTYALEPSHRARSLLETCDAPAFVLDGLSKSAGMPGIKAGWIVVLGPPVFRDAAIARLEIIADTYLSVGSPVQKALPRLIELGAAAGAEILGRIRANAAALRSALAGGSACAALRAEGGWSAILRLPRTLSEEDWCLRLLGDEGVLVQPGWFYDFESEAYLVVSLLTAEAEFREGVARIRRCAG